MLSTFLNKKLSGAAIVAVIITSSYVLGQYQGRKAVKDKINQEVIKIELKQQTEKQRLEKIIEKEREKLSALEGVLERANKKAIEKGLNPDDLIPEWEHSWWDERMRHHNSEVRED